MPIWFQARRLGMNTKRQQAAALQALRANQRPLHPRQRLSNHWDQRAVPCDGVEADISEPGMTEGPGGCKSGGRCPPDNFGSGYAGLGNMRVKPIAGQFGLERG